MKDRDFLLIQGDMQSRLHLRPGLMRDLFAIIYNYSKDGVNTYRASTEKMAEWLGCSERHVMDLINTLLKSGYINRVGKTKDKSGNGHEIFEYTTNYEELLERAKRGEVIRPLSITRRAKKGGESSPIEKGGESSSERVVKVPKKGGESSSQYKDIDKDISKDSLYGAQAREDTETEYFKIFFLRNAKNPMAEVRRFVGWYEGQRWTDSRGKKYETLAQRRGLAYAWEFREKSGRLPENEMNGRFYEFLGDLYNQAVKIGDIDPALFLDMATRFEVPDSGRFRWFCKREVMDWVESHLQVAQVAKATHLGKDTKLSYSIKQ